MASKLDLLRERYEQFSRGDLEGALSNWSEDFTWEGGNSEGAWDEFSLAADEFFEDGDTVVVLGHSEVKKGDQGAKLPVVHIWRFRGDDEVCRLQILTDTLHAAQLLGKA